MNNYQFKIIGILLGLFATFSVASAAVPFEASVNGMTAYRDGEKQFAFFIKAPPVLMESLGLSCPDIPDFEWKVDITDGQYLLGRFNKIITGTMFPNPRRCKLNAYGANKKKIGESVYFTFDPKGIAASTEENIPYPASLDFYRGTVLWGRYRAERARFEKNSLHQTFTQNGEDAISFSADFYGTFSSASWEFSRRMHLMSADVDPRVLHLYSRKDMNLGDESFCAILPDDFEDDRAAVECDIRVRNVVLHFSDALKPGSGFSASAARSAFQEESRSRFAFFAERLSGKVRQKQVRLLRVKYILAFVNVIKDARASCGRNSTCLSDKIRTFLVIRNKNRRQYAVECKEEGADSQNACILQKFEKYNTW